MGLRKIFFKNRSNQPDSFMAGDGKLNKSMWLQESLREVQSRYRKLLIHTQAIQYTHDLRGQFLSVDQEITEFLGYDRNSLLKMNIRTILASEVRHKFEAYLGEIKRQGVAKGLMVVQTAVGEKRILKYYNTLRTEDVPTPFVQGIAYDVTEQKQARKTLKHLSGQLSVILKSLPIVCYIGKAEEDYGATYITHNVKAITGFEQTDFTSKSSFWANRIHPEDAPKIFADLPQIFEKGYHEHQYRWQVADGSYKWFYDYTRLIKSSDGKNYIIGMMQDITERKRAEEALLNAAQQWRTTFDGISDFVSLLDLEGKILRCNKAMKDFVGKPFNEIINHSWWEIILGATTPIEDCHFLRMKETLHRETTTLSVNDLWFNVSVDPIFDQAGRLIGAVNIISDITKRKQAEEAVTKLSQENAVMAEIGRIVSSTLNIEEVYERFAEEVHKLISFDRITINIINPKDNTTAVSYATGIDVESRRAGDIFPLVGSVAEECIRTQSSLLFQPESVDAVVNRFPLLLPPFKAGLRSMIFVPLISKDQVIGVLSLQATKPNIYKDQDLKLAVSIGGQIAGAIANVQLFIERKRMEDALRESEVKFKDLFDHAPLGYQEYDIEGRITNVNRTDLEMLGYTAEEMIGQPIWKFNVQEDTLREQVLAKLAGTLPPGRNLERTYRRKDGTILPVLIEDRLILDEKGRIKGIRSTVQDITQRKQVEEALQTSEEEAKRLSQENAIMAEIGRIVSSSLDIDEVYERFSEEVRKLISFHRIMINIVNLGNNTTSFGYITGIDIQGRRVGDIVPLEGTATGECVRMRSSFLFQTESMDEVVKRFPRLLPTFKAGLRSMIFVPLISKDQVIGVLSLRTTKPNAYTEADLNLAERVGNQIAGAIANAQLFIERKRAEEALQRSEEEARRLSQENAVVAEIGQIISSTLNIEEVYERFVEKVRKLIPFDRTGIQTVNPRDNTTTLDYISGVDVEKRRSGDVIPLEGTAIAECVRTQSSFLFQTENLDEVQERFPGLLPTFKAGLRSMICVPLISKDEVIGVFHLRSLKLNAYTVSDLKLAERVGNQIAGAIANAQLFIERKQMEEALRKSEERFRDLYDHAPLGYHEYDAEGRITCVNRTDLEMLGYTAEEMIGQSMWKFNVGENTVREQILAKLAGAAPPGRNLERIYRRKDGTTFPVLIEDRLILDEKGQIRGIRCTTQDITERKRAEEEKESLREQLRQSQKMEAIGKLAGGVAHDFNNLLTVIHGYSELLLSSLDQDSRFRQDVQEIITASERASTLTRQLLAFSRRQVLQPKVLDLNAHVSNMDKMLRRMIGEDIELVTLLSKDLGRIKADPGQIEQVILNLAVNAKDIMLDGGKLTIETTNVKLDEGYARSRIGVTPGDYVMLSVSDTGVGMTPEIKERIFEPFFTTKEKGKGTGLGLSTVHGIVQQSGGNIWVYSEPGLGTTFKIYLPRIEEGTESLRPAAASTKPLQGSETVLLVEDEEMVRKLACTVLEKNGYRVLEASNGDKALDVVQGQNGNPIDLMVTDVVMPGMSGRQLADRLVSLRPELKVLYMSGYTDDAIVHHGVLDQGIAYIQKPFTPDALASKVREILDGN